jgi:hypothetical protein
MAPLLCYNMNHYGMGIGQSVASDLALHAIDRTAAEIWRGYGAGVLLWHGLLWHGYGSARDWLHMSCKLAWRINVDRRVASDLELHMISYTGAATWHGVWRRCIAMAWNAMA